MKYNLKIALLIWGFSSPALAQNLPDIKTVPLDLQVPPMVEGVAAAGKRVRVVTKKYQGTEVHHSLYLPVDWKVGKRYPVIVEYAGNGPFKNKFGDICSGKVEDCNLGYGISGGKGVIWVCLPYVSVDGEKNQRQWWGDVDATVEYCKEVVAQICEEYGGDSSAVILAGFSRGSIACNFIGLHDDEIAAFWKGFICHSHYDGVKNWNYAGSDRDSATERLQRLNGRPQFISHEGSVDETKGYLEQVYPKGNFVFQTISYRNHTDSWVLRDVPERKLLRKWVRENIHSGFDVESQGVEKSR
ncbi:MAG: hypothetical protein QM496_18980 [Verrucomicrobiota bacterium]